MADDDDTSTVKQSNVTHRHETTVSGAPGVTSALLEEPLTILC